MAKNKIRFLVIWIGLFAITVGMRALITNADPVVAPSTETDDASTLMAELDAKPRKSVVFATSVALMGKEREFDNALSRYVLSHKDQLSKCRASVMEASSRATEYLEISFVPRSIAANRASGSEVVRLDSLILERATLAISAAQERCILQAFSDFEIEVSAAPAERTFFNLCFKQRSRS